MSHELKPLDPRRVFTKVSTPREEFALIGDLLETMSWNMNRMAASNILAQLQREIRRAGGERQRGEGYKMLERVRRRLREWVE